MAYMFRGASSFNQSLCPWAALLPSDVKDKNAVDAFLETDCPHTSDPNLSSSSPGPFCYICAPTGPAGTSYVGEGYCRSGVTGGVLGSVDLCWTHRSVRSVSDCNALCNRTDPTATLGFAYGVGDSWDGRCGCYHEEGYFLGTLGGAVPDGFENCGTRSSSDGDVNGVFPVTGTFCYSIDS